MKLDSRNLLTNSAGATAANTIEETPVMSKFNGWLMAGAARWQGRDKEQGQGLAEYGLILALIAVVCIAALTTMGTNITAVLGSLNAKL